MSARHLVPAPRQPDAERLAAGMPRAGAWRSRIAHISFRNQLPDWKLKLALWWSQNGNDKRP